MSSIGMAPPKRTQEILMRKTTDRRLLSHIPDEATGRSVNERRGEVERKTETRKKLFPAVAEHRGIRFEAKLPVEVTLKRRGLPGQRFTVQSKDISTSGLRLGWLSSYEKESLEQAERISLRFRITPGSLPEGYEAKVRIKARAVSFAQREDETYDCGLSFQKTLPRYIYRKRGRTIRWISLVSLLLLAALVVLMRVDSVVYFQFNQLMYLYSIITAVYLLSRYLFGALYRPVPVNPNYTPAVSIIIPCFNEEEWIQRTILSCLDQEYPPEQLEVIIVDDCSNDHSPTKIRELLARLYADESRYQLKDRVRYVRQERNQGKREAMARGVKMAKHDLVVFVDSDSFLDPAAIRNLVQPFQDPKMGGVSGRTDVANTYTNFITKMQSVKYFISFRIMKAAEGYFDAVTCLSGPLSCYRKEVVLEHCDAWLGQTFLGQRATFGDDRSLTNFVLRKHRATYQDTAICSTIVPNTNRMFLKQQIRWKRSWLRESSIAATFMWKKEPMMALSFYFGFIIPILAPVIVIYNLLYIPLAYGFFPRTFLIGLLAMSMLMSMTQLLLRRSRIWIYGAYYCLYHLLILMWQMPYAWVTFWKSTWGTRLTPEDLAAMERRWGAGSPQGQRAISRE